MKKIIFLLFLFPKAYSQDLKQLLQEREDFYQLVKKVQNDKMLTGNFMYKGYRVTIIDDSQMRTVVGKFIIIGWKEEGFSYRAYYHNTLGYMTRSNFNNRRSKQFKINDSKYCQSNNCWELRTDATLPYIVEYRELNSELPEIK